MVFQIGRNIQIRWAFFLSILMSTLVWAEEAAKPAAPPTPATWPVPHWAFLYAVVLLVLLGSFLALAYISAALVAPKWSLAEALSEEVQVTEMVEVQGKQGVTTARLDANGKPIMITKMGPSSSRLIALMGMMVILLMFLGFGAFVLYSFGKTGNMPSTTKDVVRFLLGGLTLFAPYAVNKFASIFESLSPKQG